MLIILMMLVKRQGRDNMDWKFEYVFAVLILLFLGLALAAGFYVGQFELVNVIITALIGGFSGITAYFFTKHNPNNTDSK